MSDICEKVLQGRSGTSSYMPGGSHRCPSDCLEMFLNSSPAAAAQKSMTEGILGDQWLDSVPFAAEGKGSISGQETKILKLCSHKK